MDPSIVSRISAPLLKALGRGHSTNGRRETKGVTLSLGQNIEFVSGDGGRTITRIFGGVSSDTDRVTRATAFVASAYCYVAIRYRMRKISEASLIVVQENPKAGASDREWLHDHALAEILEEPSPDYDMQELVARTVAYVDITGGCIWVKDVTRGGTIGRLTPFHRDEFTIHDTDDRIYGRYRLSGDVSFDRREKAPEEVVHFQEPNPFDWWRGTSKVEVALQSLNLSQQAIATTKDILKNALFPSVVVQAKEDWNPDDDEWEWFKQQLDRYSDRDLKGGPLALLGGGTATQVGLSLKDLIPSDVLRSMESVVAGVFHIPPIVLGYQVGLENSPWSNITEARSIAYDDGIAPEWRAMASRITRQLLWAPVQPGGQPFEADHMRRVVFDTSGIPALQKDVALMTDVAQKQAQIASLNERRMLVGLEPVKDPRADEIPELAEPQPPPSPPGGFENPFAADAPPADEEDDVDGEVAARRPRLSTKSSRRDVWRAFDRGTKQATDEWERPISEELSVQASALGRLVERVLAGKRGSHPPETKQLDESSAGELLEAVDEWIETRGVPRLRAITYPLVTGTAQAGVASAAGNLGLSFQLLQPGLLDFAAEETVFLADAMGKTTGELVSSLVQEGIESGDTVQKLVRRLEDSAAFAADRARLVARTETTRAWNGAQRRQLSGLQERTGTRVVKEWLTAGDDRVRPEHADIDGERKAIDEEFSIGLQNPSEPNCRCTLTYELVGDDE